MIPHRAAAAGLVATLLGCAGAGIDAVDPSGWHEIHTSRFAVLGDVPVEELRSLAAELVLFDALVERVTNARLARSTVPVRLYVFAERRGAEPFTGDAAGILLPALGGYFAILDAEGPLYQTQRILFHEYVHYALRSGRHLPYPPWYDEGTSEFLATANFRDGAVIVGAPPSGWLASLEALGPLPLETLFESPARVEVWRFYATAWALVHHLNASGEGRARLHRFAGRLARGEDWRAAYAESFDASLAELEADLAAHVAALQRGARLDYHLRADALSPESEWALQAVPPAEIDYQLATIARNRAQLTGDSHSRAMARALYARAIAADPEHARARAGLAVALAPDGNLAEAAALLERALGDAPRDPAVQLEAGLVHAARAAEDDAARAEAARAFERAVALGPDLPETHDALGRFLASSGEPLAAIPALERARALGGWSPELDLELARAHLAAGERARAVELLRPVAADVHAGRAAREARRLLDGLPEDGAAARPTR